MGSQGFRTGSVFGLRREIDRLFEDTSGGDSGRGAWAPPVDIREDESGIVIEVELPGIKRADVDVTSENGLLTISGEKRSTAQSSDGRHHLVERSYGAFKRSFRLPTGVDEQRIAADFADGLLVVHVPKAAIAEPRRIEIRGGSNTRGNA